MPPLKIETHLLSDSGDLVVLNKPPGWPTTGRSLEDPDCVQFHLIHYFGRMVWALHQLDADTSGVCLFSLKKEIIAEIKAIWGSSETRKDYYAFVQGEPGWDHYEDGAPIGEISPGRLGVCASGKAASTSFTVLDRQNGYSLMQCRLHTGRTHQVRIHLAHLGFPLIGEEWYGPQPCTLHPRQALHACRLQLPASNHAPARAFTAPLAPDLLALAATLRLRVTPHR